MADVSVKGSRGGALTLTAAGLLILLASFATWRVCPTTPCGGPFQAFSFYSGIDLGFGVVTAGTGVVLAAIGVHAFRRGGTSRFAAVAVLVALVAPIAAVVSLAWMRFAGSGDGVGWLSVTAIFIGILGLVSIAAAARVRRATPSHP